VKPEDPRLIASQYGTEAPLEARRSIARHFVRVDRRDVDAWTTVEPEGVQRWVESLGGKPRPRLVDTPVRARIACAILVAEA
jgi:hypothetical protein